MSNSKHMYTKGRKGEFLFFIHEVKLLKEVSDRAELYS